jgi:hypothetical protein
MVQALDRMPLNITPELPTESSIVTRFGRLAPDKGHYEALIQLINVNRVVPRLNYIRPGRITAFGAFSFGMSNL